MGIAENISRVREKIEKAAKKAGRDPKHVRLVAVSKTVSEDRVKEAAEKGCRLFGENYVQEALKKADKLTGLNLSWHFIGHLQSNKAKYAVKIFDLIHSVDSKKLASALDREAAKIKKIQKVLVQVNLAKEPTKSGIDPEKLLDLLYFLSSKKNLAVRGLMIIPPFFDDPQKVRPYFSDLRRLSVRTAGLKIEGISMDELSMGMSHDFEVAIEEGATLVRVGTAIFGARS